MTFEPEPDELDERDLSDGWRSHLDDRRRLYNERFGKCFEPRMRYATCTLANFECPTDRHVAVREALRNYGHELGENVKAGRSVILLGPPGTGKDHLVASLVKHAIKSDVCCRWENGAELFGEVRDRMAADQSEASFVSKYAWPEVLALSDPIPPFGKLTEFQAIMLYRIIDARYSAGKPTWVTINAESQSDAESKLGPQVVDRLAHNALIVACNWPSYRQPSERV